MIEPISVLLVDDHALLRETLAERLNREDWLRVVGFACDAEHAIRETIRVQPNIILMDIDMPGLICFDAAQTIKSIQPETGLIFLSAHAHDSYIERALDVGARGYVTKDEPTIKVVAAIREVADGGAYFSPDVQSRLSLGSDGIKLSAATHTRGSVLSLREREVLEYIARGYAKKTIASTMHLSVKTVDRHCTNLMTKLDIHDRVDLTRYAIREGIVVV